MTLLQDSEVDALISGSPFGQPPQSKNENLASLAKEMPPVTTVIAQPYDPGPTAQP